MPIIEANETKSLTLQEIVLNLNIKQQSFCEFYLKGDEAHVAYRKAGYKTKNSINATTLAHRLMSTNVYVRAFITRHREIKHEEFTFDRHQFAMYLKDAIDGKWDEEQVVVVGRGTEARVIKRKISPRDRIKAMEIAERVFKIVDDTPSLQSTETSAIVDFSQGVSKHSTKNTDIDTLGRSPSTTDATPPLDEDV